jgi:hypothetical protein
VLGTGDSDFTPLVHKLRELNRRVIGVGIEASTSALLPPACDEFLFYERLEGVEPAARRRTTRGSRGTSGQPAEARAADVVDQTPAARPDDANLGVVVTQTLSGLERTANGPVLASLLKRTMLRKDPTFNEADYGFRGFSELLHHLADIGLIELAEGSAKGDPQVTLPLHGKGEDEAFELLQATVERLASSRSGPPHLSGLKTQMRKTQPDFSEKLFGYGGFLQFARAARSRGLIEMEFDEQADDYVLRPATPPRAS